jgi:hypothetical protein
MIKQIVLPDSGSAAAAPFGKALKRVGAAAFLAFLLKGLLWIAIACAALRM